MGALRPAWGNPKGLVARSVGENLFIAEFGSRQDLERVLDGSPWNVNKRAVLVKRYDQNQRSTDIVFNLLPIWVRIMNLPFGLMNGKWGGQLAGMIGEVEKLDLDDQGRAWGPYLRAKVAIDVSKPLRRCVGIFSARQQTNEWYDVQYEKLPYFCFSCGIIRHSSIECPSPAARDDKGLLPYGENLRVPDDKKKKQIDDKQGHASPSSGRNTISRGRYDGTETNSAQHISVSLENERDLNNKSLNKPSEIAGRDNLILMNDLMDIQGRKHKQNETTEYDIDSSQLMHQISVNDLAIVPHVPGSQPTFEEPDSGSDDLEQKKKMKTEENFPMELSAVAGFQPRREQ